MKENTLFGEDKKAIAPENQDNNSENYLPRSYSQRSESPDESHSISVPQLSLPKGGGAIKGIGEKFQPNPFTGTATLSIPIYSTTGRSGFGPDLSISYGSGEGNGIFGLGWSLSLPAITRKTEKELPQYLDQQESDTFILSGTEDLVPAFKEGTLLPDEKDSLDGKYLIKTYIPRTEGLFAKIEKWINKIDNTVHFWRTISRENITAIYGNTAQARITDKSGKKVFSWLIEQQFDDKGNLIIFAYEEDNVTEAFHQNAQSKYLKKILYGNKDQINQDFAYYTRLDYTNENNFHFKVLFDYGDHKADGDNFPSIDYDPRLIPPRQDPFSSYRSGFEIRTRRLCRKVLVFHHFPNEGLNNQLVKSTEFTYKEGQEFSKLQSVKLVGYDLNLKQIKEMPPAEFKYSEIPLTLQTLDPEIQEVSEENLENLPQGLSGLYQLVDLDAEGVSGILVEQGGDLYYKKPGGYRTNAQGKKELIYQGIRVLSTQSNPRDLQTQQLVDVDGDGRLELVQYNRSLPGYFSRTENEDWEPFIAFENIPNIPWDNPHIKFLDLNGNGKADILFSEDERFVWYPSLGKKGFDNPQSCYKKQIDKPTLLFTDLRSSILLADMSGDGLQDIVRVSDGLIEYWPNLGYAEFSEKIDMPFSTDQISGEFNPNRIRLADIDGSGTVDVIYLDEHNTKVFFNQAGNQFSQPYILSYMAPANNLTSVQVADITGSGTNSIVWSNPDSNSISFIDLMGGLKPHLLISMENNFGGEIAVEYESSTSFYFADKEVGTPWISKLPFPVHVIKKITHIDHITKSNYTTEYSYHHGLFDFADMEFRGFGRVDTLDIDRYNKNTLDQAPVLTKSWYHTGYWLKQTSLSQYYRENEYYSGDSQAWPLDTSVIPANLTIAEIQEAHRSLRGRIMRQEVYGMDGSVLENKPYSVSESNFSVRCLQKTGSNKHAVFHTIDGESIEYHYERNPSDPRIIHQISLDADKYGNVTHSASIAYPRRPQAAVNYDEEQKQVLCSISQQNFGDFFEPETKYIHSVPIINKLWEVAGFSYSPRTKINGPTLYGEYQSAQEFAFLDDIQTNGSGPRIKCLSESYQTYRAQNGTELNQGQITVPVLPYQSYQKTFTTDIFTQAFGSLGLNPFSELETRGKYIYRDSSWWIPSGVQKVSSANFFLPDIFISPFTENPEDPVKNYRINYDPYSLMPISLVDPLGSMVSVLSVNYRVVQVTKLSDINDLETEVSFDALGIVVASALLGKAIPYSYDTLANFDPNFDAEQFLLDPINNAESTLKGATSLFAYDLLHYFRTKNSIRIQPVMVSNVTREDHGSANNKFQISINQQDGLGRDLQSKLFVNYGGGKEWLVSGRTLYNNKGNPVEQHEQFFSSTHNFILAPPNTVSKQLYYDPVGREIKTEFPDGSYSRIEFSPWLEQYFDQNDTSLDHQVYANGNVPQVTDPEPADKNDRVAWLTIHHANTPTENHLDVLSRSYKAIATNINNEKSTIKVSYDLMGKPLNVFDALSEADPSRPAAIESVYDMAGNAIRNNGLDNGSRRILIDIAGNPVFTADSKNHLIHLEYDSLMRPTQKILSSGGNKLLEKTEYGDTADKSWNGNGQLKKSYDGTGIVSVKEYDGKQNLLKTERQLLYIDYANFPFQNNDQIIHDWNGPNTMEQETFIIQTRYDALNRPVDSTHLVKKNNNLEPLYRVANSFNQGGQLFSTKVSNKRNAVLDADLFEYVESITYNNKGQREEIRYGNSITTKYVYDPTTFRLKELISKKGTAAPLQNIFYTYDPVGNIVEIEDKAQQTVYYDGMANKPISRYRYDALYRLVLAEGREHKSQNDSQVSEENPFVPVTPAHPNDQAAFRYYRQEYHYDKNGNLDQMDHSIPSGGWTRIYTYAQHSNRLLQTARSNNTPNTSPLTHDANGNIDSMAHLNQILWDHHDRMIKTNKTVNAAVANPPGTSWYLYDVGGQRIRKIFKASASSYKERIYLGIYDIFREHQGANLRNEIETFHVSDDQDRIALLETITINSGNPIISAVPVIRYQLNNHNNSSHLELNENGVVISYEEFHPYGTTSYISKNNTISQKRYSFTGKEKDEETGFYYHGARYYIPWLGRWSSPDPAGFVDGLNVYAYVKGSPVNLVDASGLGSGKRYIQIPPIHIVGDPNTTEFPMRPRERDYDFTKESEHEAWWRDIAEWNEYMTEQQNAGTLKIGGTVFLIWGVTVAIAAGGYAAAAGAKVAIVAKAGEAFLASSPIISGAIIGGAGGLGAESTNLLLTIPNEGKDILTGQEMTPGTVAIRLIIAGGGGAIIGGGLGATTKYGPTSYARLSQATVADESLAIVITGQSSWVQTRGTLQGAERAYSRVQELAALRRAKQGAEAVIVARNIKTDVVKTFITIETAQKTMPKVWQGKLKPGEVWLSGPGHAEETFVTQTSSDWVILEGASRPNVCYYPGACVWLIGTRGAGIGGPDFGTRAGRVPKTSKRLFWQE